jgi:hypothetical protein
MLQLMKIKDLLQFLTYRGIHIEHDPKQNRFSGLPDAWKAAIPEQCLAQELSGVRSDIPEFLIPTNHKVFLDFGFRFTVSDI